MKAILEFDLDNPDDSIAHMRAVKALDMTLVLWEICHNTKKGIYNQIEFNNLDAYGVVDKIYEKLYEELNEHQINLDKLIN